MSSVYDELGIWLDAIKGIDSAQRAVRELNEEHNQTASPQYMSTLRILGNLCDAEKELRGQFQIFVDIKRAEANELKEMFDDR